MSMCLSLSEVHCGLIPTYPINGTSNSYRGQNLSWESWLIGLTSLLGKWLLWHNKENVPKGYFNHFTHNNSRSWVTGAIFFFFFLHKMKLRQEERSHRAEVNSSEQPLGSHFCFAAAIMWCGARHLTSLCLSCLISKVEITIGPPSQSCWKLTLNDVHIVFAHRWFQPELHKYLPVLVVVIVVYQ